MKSEVKITAEIESLTFGWWDDKSENFIPLTADVDVSAFLKRSDYRNKLIDAINMLAADISDKVADDLKDIWKRMDEIESKLKELGV